MTKRFKYLLWIIGLSVVLFIYNKYFSNCEPATLNSIVNGLYASLTAVLIFEIFGQCKMRKNYKYLEGNDWKEYCSINHNNGPAFNFTCVTGNAVINYYDENILDIKLTETKLTEIKNNKTWDGKITMDKSNNKSGRVTWKYEPENEFHLFGLKELIVTNDKNFDYIYLMSINYGINQIIEGTTVKPLFGNVVLRRTRKK